MKIENKKDSLGKYQKITMPNNIVYIQRFFKELGLLVKIKADANRLTEKTKI